MKKKKETICDECGLVHLEKDEGEISDYFCNNCGSVGKNYTKKGKKIFCSMCGEEL